MTTTITTTTTAPGLGAGGGCGRWARRSSPRSPWPPPRSPTATRRATTWRPTRCTRRTRVNRHKRASSSCSACSQAAAAARLPDQGRHRRGAGGPGRQPRDAQAAAALRRVGHAEDRAPARGAGADRHAPWPGRLGHGLRRRAAAPVDHRRRPAAPPRHRRPAAARPATSWRRTAMAASGRSRGPAVTGSRPTCRRRSCTSLAAVASATPASQTTPTADLAALPRSCWRCRRILVALGSPAAGVPPSPHPPAAEPPGRKPNALLGFPPWPRAVPMPTASRAARRFCAPRATSSPTHGYRGASLALIAERVGMSCTGSAPSLPDQGAPADRPSRAPPGTDVARLEALTSVAAGASSTPCWSSPRGTPRTRPRPALHDPRCGEPRRRSPRATSGSSTATSERGGSSRTGSSRSNGSGLIRDDVDVELTAAQILAMFDGLQLQWLLEPAEVDIVAALTDYIGDLRRRAWRAPGPSRATSA